MGEMSLKNLFHVTAYQKHPEITVQPLCCWYVADFIGMA